MKQIVPCEHPGWLGNSIESAWIAVEFFLPAPCERKAGNQPNVSLEIQAMKVGLD
jgi:hypothetical protein